MLNLFRLITAVDNAAASATNAAGQIVIECDSISNYQRGRQYCIIKALRIDARNATVFYEPSLFSDVKRELLFDMCQLHAIPAGIFAAFPNLRTMYTWNSGLQSLQPDDFAGAAALRTIDLSQNNISTLVESTFFGAIDLEYINLASNRIDRLPKFTFHGLVRLRVLRLSDNRIGQLPVGMFDVLPRLQMLYADGNRIDRIGGALLVRNVALQEVHLQANRITEVERQPFEHLRQLTSFRLDSNPVRGLDCLHVDAVHTDIRNVSAGGAMIGRRTETLLAAHNRIAYVSVAPDDGGVALKRLDLQANRMRQFSNLTGLRALRHLDLSANRFEDLGVPSFAEMPALIELRLRASGLQHISFGLFSRKPALRWLDVSHNRMRHVQLNRFTGLQAVRALFLEANELRHIDLTGVRQYFPLLETIGLAQNPWNCSNLAAGIKVLEANGIALNAVGMARNRTNIGGIPCEAQDAGEWLNSGSSTAVAIASDVPECNSISKNGMDSVAEPCDAEQTSTTMTAIETLSTDSMSSELSSTRNARADSNDDDADRSTASAHKSPATVPQHKEHPSQQHRRQQQHYGYQQQQQQQSTGGGQMTIVDSNLLLVQLVRLKHEATVAAASAIRIPKLLQKLLDYCYGAGVLRRSTDDDNDGDGNASY